MAAFSIHHLPFTIYPCLFDDAQQVRDFLDEAARGGRVGTLHDLIQLGQSQTVDDLFMLFGAAM